VKTSSYGEPDYAFGQRMLTLRTQIGLTQAGLGERLGVSRRAVVKWEGGLSYPSVGHLQALIALGVELHVFAAGGEAEEIRALWRVSHQKVLLDEQWLQGLLATGRPRPPQPRRGSSPARPSTTVESRPPGQLVAPLVGRAAAFSQLVDRYQQAQQGQPQAALLVGEAGIGKTRLAREFVAWARTRGAEVLSGHAFELGGRLPYQPLVEAIGPRLEEENAPEDLLSDLWLAELSRLLPELRVRSPDLPAPTQDELTAKIRLFEAVARLVEALTLRAPLVLLFDDLHWMDGASLDLLRYLGHDWSRQSSRVLLLLTVRSEGLGPQSQLAVELSDLGRDLSVSQVSLQPLSQTETIQLLEAVVGAREPGEASPSRAVAAQPGESETKLSGLGDILFAQTGGHRNTVQIRRKERNETRRRMRWHTRSHQHHEKGNRLMIPTIRQIQEESKVCQQIDLGLLQEVLPSAKIEDLLETYQMWEDRERKLNMVVLTYWLIALHVYPRVSMRAVYAKLVSGQRAWRDDVPQQTPVKSAFSYRREHLGSELLEELFVQCAGPKATEQTPGAFWHGLRRLSIDGTVESVPDTPSNREAFRYSTDDAESQSPFPQARLVVLVECGTHLICDAERSRVPTRGSQQSAPALAAMEVGAEPAAVG
jgi:transcriptional regulator with XRE-family HTH domain